EGGNERRARRLKLSARIREGGGNDRHGGSARRRQKKGTVDRQSKRVVKDVGRNGSRRGARRWADRRSGRDRWVSILELRIGRVLLQYEEKSWFGSHLTQRDLEAVERHVRSDLPVEDGLGLCIGEREVSAGIRFRRYGVDHDVRVTLDELRA